MLCSLWRNNIGDKGAAALAAILKETQISDLKCAATLSVFAFVSAPVDTLALLHIPALPLVCSLGWNSIGAEGASALAAILKETQITTLGCAAALECSHLCQRPLTLLLPLAAWLETSSVASPSMATAPTPLRASPICARRSRGAP